MNLFIAIHEAKVTESAVEKVRSLVPNGVYEISDHVLLIRGPFEDASAVSTLLNLDSHPETPLVGLVFKLNGSYSGYYYNKFGEWLKEAKVG